ncbi:MAG: TRAP transporter large permease subunit, partial [Gammaproteobacteria bacterium]|nr:TRAP transporter large permease subunit [Gammaproteobacteria bacterium]
MEGIILFAAAMVLLVLGFPVAFSLGGLSLSVMFLVGSDFLGLYPSRVFGVMHNTLLMAVPLFVFMGVMLERSGLAEELLETMALLFGRIKGGLAISVVVVGAMLAASTGIVGATVVTMGLLSLPTMLKREYSPAVATGTISASGTLGQIIPPSIVLVLLGSVLNVSIGEIFFAAMIPGFILAGLYVLYLYVLGRVRPDLAPSMPEADLAHFHGRVAVVQTFTSLVPPLLLILAVLGSIFFGVASPTEAAAVGAVGASLLTVARGKFTRATVKAAMTETLGLTAMVFTILLGATAFGLAFRALHGDLYLQEVIRDANLGEMAFLLMFLGVIFIAGFFIDFIEITFIHVPVAAPIFHALGVDMVWLGVLIAINLQTSFLTPPFGFSLFYLKGVAPPEIKTTHIYKGIIPFVIIQVVGLALVILFPELAL